MTQQVHTYNSFIRGEYGTLGGEQAGQFYVRSAGASRNGYFHAKNMKRLRSGYMCPRPGLKKITISNIPAGTLYGMGWNGTPGFSLWLVVNQNVVKADALNGSTASVLGTIASTPTSDISGKELGTGKTYFTVPGDKTYVIDHILSTLTAITGSPGGIDIDLYGDRMVVASYGTNRVRYSEALDYTNWPAANFFDAQIRSAIGAVFAQRGHLTILAESNEFIVVTGVPGVNASQRRVAGSNSHPWLLHARQAVLLGTDQILFIPVSADFPAMFNGLSINDERHLGLFEGVDGGYTAYATIAKAVRGFRPNEGIININNQMAEFRSNVWQIHTIENITLSNFAASENQGRVYFATNSGTPAVYSYYTALERPAFTSDAYASPGDNSTTPMDAYLHMPEHWEESGDIRVKKIIVDFIKYDTGSPSTNHFQVDVDVLGRFENTAPVTHSALTFDEAGGSATTAGVHQRKEFILGEAGSGAGYQVKLSAIRGVVIKGITVFADTNPARGA